MMIPREDEVEMETDAIDTETAEQELGSAIDSSGDELAVGETGSLLEDEAAEQESEIQDALPSELSDVQVKSVVESVLFASNNPVSVATLRGVFHNTDVDTDRIRRALDGMQTDYAGGERGIMLVEVAGGWQLRTKIDNMPWVRRQIKGRTFKLSGASMEVLSIIAYKQPVVKAEIDQIRGVESGHLVRMLMEKNMVRFAGKSELPGKPMLYATTREFLELFGLRNIRELPTLSEINDLIPEGIGGEDAEKETLDTLTDKLSLPIGQSYSDSEAELLTISDDLASITTSSEFFEEEKKRQREQRDRDRAQDIRERKIMGEEIAETDVKWLARYESKIDQVAKDMGPEPAVPGPEVELQPEAKEATPEVVTEEPEVVGANPELTSEPETEPKAELSPEARIGAGIEAAMEAMADLDAPNNDSNI